MLIAVYLLGLLNTVNSQTNPQPYNSSLPCAGGLPLINGTDGRGFCDIVPSDFVCCNQQNIDVSYNATFIYKNGLADSVYNSSTTNCWNNYRAFICSLHCPVNSAQFTTYQTVFYSPLNITVANLTVYVNTTSVNTFFQSCANAKAFGIPVSSLYSDVSAFIFSFGSSYVPSGYTIDATHPYLQYVLTLDPGSNSIPGVTAPPAAPVVPTSPVAPTSPVVPNSPSNGDSRSVKMSKFILGGFFAFVVLFLGN